MPNAAPEARRPKVRLLHNWLDVLKWAWSVRLMALAAVLSGLEVLIQVLTAYAYKPPIPVGLFAALSGLVTVAAFAARFVAQKGLSK
jgi:hypothetical protein